MATAQPMAAAVGCAADDDVAEATALEERRRRAREAQRKSRANRKAQQASFDEATAKLADALRIALAACEQRKTLCHDLRGRAYAAYVALDAVRADLARLTPPTAACTLDDDTPLLAPAQTQLDAPHRHRPAANRIAANGALVTVPDPVGGHAANELPQAAQRRPGLCLFRPAEGLAQRREEVHVLPSALRRVAASQGVGMLAAALAFREGEAMARGCAPSDVRWLLDSERHPELAGDGAVASDMGTPGCTARALVGWIASLLERSALLYIHNRLQALSNTFRSARNVDVRLTDSDEPRLGPLAAEDDACATSIGNSDWMAHALHVASEAMASVDLSATAPPAAGQASTMPLPRGGGRASLAYSDGVRLRDAELRGHAERGTLSAANPNMAPGGPMSELTAATRSVVERVLGRYLVQMHPEDALDMCQRIRTHFSPQRRCDAAAAVTPLGTLELVMAVAISVIQAAADAVRLNPVEPDTPTTLEGVDAAIAAVRGTLHDVLWDTVHIKYFTHLDARRLTQRMSQGLGPHSIGFVKFEQLNLRAYAETDLTLSQKHAVRAIWEAHQAAAKSLDAEFSRAVAALSRLPPAPGASAVRGPHDRCPRCDAHLSPAPSCGASPESRPNVSVHGSGRACDHERGDVREGRSGASRGSIDEYSWTAHLLGASPDATEAAAEALAALQDVQARMSLSHLELEDRLLHALSEAQVATLMTCTMPLKADLGRIAELACRDVVRESVFGCGAAGGGPAEGGSRHCAASMQARVELPASSGGDRGEWVVA